MISLRMYKLAARSVGTVSFLIEFATHLSLVFCWEHFLAPKLFFPMREAALY